MRRDRQRQRQRANSGIQAVTVGQCAMIHKNERARLRRYRCWDRSLAVRGREKFWIGAIEDNRQLLRWHSSIEQQLLKGPANGHDVVRKRGGDLLLPGC